MRFGGRRCARLLAREGRSRPVRPDAEATVSACCARARLKLRRASKRAKFECDAAAKSATLAIMPTVLRSGPYRVYFHSHEPNEPPHVHIDRDDRTAKFWLVPVALARNLGFAPHELTRIEALIQEHRQTLLEAWNEHFGS
jgi:hypothetical protein